MIASNTLKGPMGWSIASIAVIGVFCVVAISTILTPLLAISDEVVANSQSHTLIETHDEYALVDIARFNGRSAFFKPIPLPRPIPTYVPPPKIDPRPPEEPKEPPAPQAVN